MQVAGKLKKRSGGDNKCTIRLSLTIRQRRFNTTIKNINGIQNILIPVNMTLLRLRPCRRPLWQLRASRLLPWWLGSILSACWLVMFLRFRVSFASSLCWDVCWLASFWMLFSMSFLRHLLLPRYGYRPGQWRTALRLRFWSIWLLIALLFFCCPVLVSLYFSVEMCDGSLASWC